MNALQLLAWSDRSVLGGGRLAGEATIRPCGNASDLIWIPERAPFLLDPPLGHQATLLAPDGGFVEGGILTRDVAERREVRL
ncbi:MAG: hypothetical protein FJ102_23045 [Deltaproteobacteria bacterium]|nr:hypothetical protein [Deltaproteobacteria bacterium]